MKYFTKEIGGKEVNFRLTSQDSVAIEDKAKEPLQKYIQEVSNTRCVNLLRYLRKGEVPNFSMEDSHKLFDELVDEGYSLEKIYLEIIFPALVTSGLLTQSNLEDIQRAVDNPSQAMQ